MKQTVGILFIKEKWLGGCMDGWLGKPNDIARLESILLYQSVFIYMRKESLFKEHNACNLLYKKLAFYIVSYTYKKLLKLLVK